MLRIFLVLPFLLLPLVSAADQAPERNHRTLLGFVEWTVLEPAGLRLKARLDTGASTSSLHTTHTETFKRDGKTWVRFHVPVSDHKDSEPDQPQRALVFERPIERTVRVKRKGAPSQKRYVVQLPFCLDGRVHSAAFSLTDRGNFNYPVLLGRRFLRDVALVDPGDSFLARTRCEYTPVDQFTEGLVFVDGEGAPAGEKGEGL